MNFIYIFRQLLRAAFCRESCQSWRHSRSKQLNIRYKNPSCHAQYAFNYLISQGLYRASTHFARSVLATTSLPIKDGSQRPRTSHVPYVDRYSIICYIENMRISGFKHMIAIRSVIPFYSNGRTHFLWHIWVTLLWDMIDQANWLLLVVYYYFGPIVPRVMCAKKICVITCI